MPDGQLGKEICDVRARYPQWSCMICRAGTRTPAEAVDASMPSYAICGTVEAKPLNVQRSTANRIRVGTNKPDIRSDSSVEAILVPMEAPYCMTHDRQMIAFYG